MQQPLLTGRSGRHDMAMNCPHCGESTGLRIDTVELHSAGGQSLTASAHGEDSQASIEVELTRRRKHPSTQRRHTVVLIARCEHCGASSRISFEQHKGATLFELDVERSPSGETRST